jgi:hypothetical protein
MKIVGCDLHTRYQQIVMLDQETGELVERRLEHAKRRSETVLQQSHRTGASLNYGILKFDDGSCSSHYPQGAKSSNSLRPVTSITGSCNIVLTGGDAVATNPNPKIGTIYGCGDNILLVTSGNTNQALKHAYDYCPACNAGFNGTNGHVDDFSSSQVCSAHSLGDYGNFWTADTH